MQQKADKFFLNSLFLNAVNRWPNQIALVCDGNECTYETLYKMAIQYFFAIEAELGKKNQAGCIAIYGDKSIQTVAAIMGVLLAGYAYMPLDTSWPAQRLETTIKMAAPLLMITTELNPYLKKQLSQVSNKPVTIDFLSLAEVRESNNTPGNSVQAEDIAYVLFTSGTTGTPKGVCISHRAAASAIEMLFEHVSLDQKDKIANQSAFCYDLAMFDLFAAFSVGACVHILPMQIAKVPKQFIHYIIDNQLTSLFMVNSALEYVLKYTPEVAVKLPLRNLLLTGDPFSEALREMLEKRLSGSTEVWNLYSAVEMPYAFAQQINLTEKNADYKCFSKHGSLIDYYLEDVMPGQLNQGALCIKSPVLFSGYLSESKTIKEIIQQPIATYRMGDWVELTEQGIELYGRIDRQVKVMGNRIELDDIEVNLESIENVQSASVYFDTKSDEIIAFIALQERDKSDDIIEKTIRDKSKKILPPIMNPHRYIFIESMPRTTSGKKDRKILIKNYHSDHHHEQTDFSAIS